MESRGWCTPCSSSGGWLLGSFLHVHTRIPTTSMDVQTQKDVLAIQVIQTGLLSSYELDHVIWPAVCQWLPAQDIGLHLDSASQQQQLRLKAPHSLLRNRRKGQPWRHLFYGREAENWLRANSRRSREDASPVGHASYSCIFTRFRSPQSRLQGSLSGTAKESWLPCYSATLRFTPSLCAF
jgi:hypothetical protein